MRLTPVAALTFTAAALVSAPSAHAAASHENFTDTFVSDPYNCDGTPAQDAGTVHVVLTVTQRGSSAFPYFTESNHGTVTTTNLETGRTLTQVFANNFHDLKITDNGDGTITIIQKGAGGTRFYDDTGKMVLKDPGGVWFAFDIDYNGTPSDTSDDVDVPDSFRIVKPSTGHSDFSNRNFCDDLRTFTS